MSRLYHKLQILNQRILLNVMHYIYYYIVLENNTLSRRVFIVLDKGFILNFQPFK